MSASTKSIVPLKSPSVVELTMPGSKSHSNRAIVIACLAEGQETRIHNATPCDDVALLVENLQKMGFLIEWIDEASGTLQITGGIPKEACAEPVTLFCDNAGTTVRFLTSVACLIPGTWIITGGERMQERPIADLVNALQSLGAKISHTNGCPPLTIEGGSIQGGSTILDASKSSQYLTSLLLIGSQLEGGLQIEIQSSLTSGTYVDLTLGVLKDFGIAVEQTKSGFSVSEQCIASPGNYTIEGDWSSAGAFLVLSALSGSDITFSNLSDASLQGDKAVPHVLEKMRSSEDLTIDCTDFPDQVMNLAVAAAHRTAKTVLTGIANLRIKETDRIAVIVSELQKTGIAIEEHGDDVVLSDSGNVTGAKLNSHDDHRMAMCFAVLGCLHEGISIVNPECVSKSYPQFFSDLEEVVSSPKCIAFVGMRGAGKTTIASELSKILNRNHIDTDAVFVEEHGPIADHVAANGWEMFRNAEHKITEESLVPGVVVSLGGGAIENEAIRNLLSERSIVVFLDASEELIVDRLQKEGRPPLTDKPLTEEVSEVMAKRNPLYESVASIRCTDNESVTSVTNAVVSELLQPCLS